MIRKDQMWKLASYTQGEIIYSFKYTGGKELDGSMDKDKSIRGSANQA